jgi:hypothetical protein
MTYGQEKSRNPFASCRPRAKVGCVDDTNGGYGREPLQ